MTEAADPPEGGESLLTVQLQVCLNCLRRESGTCWAPGCFFWARSVKEVPEGLALFTVAS